MNGIAARQRDELAAGWIARSGASGFVEAIPTRASRVTIETCFFRRNTMSQVAGQALLQSVEFSAGVFGDFLDDQIAVAANEMTLFPANGASAQFTVTITYTDGRPVPGQTVACASRPSSLTGTEWRTKEGLAPRFGHSAARVRQLLSQGQVRLGVRVTPPNAMTDANGKAVFRLDSFHVCGNEGTPAADEITATSAAGVNRGIVKSAVEGLAALVDDRNGGLATDGLVGRHLHPQVIQILKSVGQAWQRVEGKPEGTPNFITITGASLRWGGLNPPHMTHRFGGTADVRPIGTREGPVSVGDSHYNRDATKILVDFLHQTKASEIRFADDLPGVTKIDPSHKNHIHVSWLQNPTEPWLLPPADDLHQAISALAQSPAKLT